MMKRRENKRRTSADLLVCFPSRATNLTLTRPKSIYSPCRPYEPKPINRHRRSNSRGGPILWAKSKALMEIEEPKSPKVTCAGQIRSVKPNKNNCKNWQVVMEEIERIHNSKQKKKKKKGISWSESLGFKKDVFQFLSCLRNLRFDFQCFRALPSSTDLTTTDDDEEELEEGDGFDQTGSRSDFSKWFTVVDEQDSNSNEESVSSVPPRNALFLMRCRSAPAKSWLEEKEEEEEKANELEITKNDEKFCKLSSDIAKETWVVGGTSDLLLRSRSCQR